MLVPFVVDCFTFRPLIGPSRPSQAISLPEMVSMNGIEQYSNAPVNKHVETVEKTFELIDLGATLEETRHWCKSHGYGKGDDWGRVRLCVWSLRPYHKSFENQIGMEALKNMKGPEDRYWLVWGRSMKNRRCHCDSPDQWPHLDVFGKRTKKKRYEYGGSMGEPRKNPKTTAPRIGWSSLWYGQTTILAANNMKLHEL